MAENTNNSKYEDCNGFILLLATRKRAIFGIIFAAMCLVAYWPLLFNWKPNNKISYLKVNENLIPVLFWTQFFENDQYVLDNIKGMFKYCLAPANSCKLTNDRSLIQESAAVIFHMRDFNVGDLQKFRSPKQRWVFFLMESSPHTHREEILKNLPSKHFFNLTLPYRRDSDIVAPYGQSAADIQLSFSKSQTELKAIIRKKTKGVAWIVSNCRSTSRREEYVTELKKYIPVDVYGKCCTLNCTDCNEMLKRDYKFSLAFENSLCRDYATEKCYKSLLYSTVPVVYSRADYESIKATRNSFIDVRNFSSAKHLAFYLHFLNGNDTAYRRYFDWRFKKTGSAPERLMPWCSLCNKLMLSVPVYANHTRTFYQGIHSWWYKEAYCQPPISPFKIS